MKAEAAEAGVKAEAQSGAAAAEPEEEEDEDDEGEDAGDDMQLAWEMLEIARKIYSAAQPVDASGLAGSCPCLPAWQCMLAQSRHPEAAVPTIS